MKITKPIIVLSVLSALLMFAPAARGDVKLPALIGDNMVVQQGMKDRIWGWAEPGENVTVSMAGLRAAAAADSKGRWEVRIGPFEAGGPYEMTIAAKNTVVLKNVLAGEVWVASGQSNMEWPLQNAAHGAEAVAQADVPQIHLFTVTKATSVTPLDDVQGRWVVCSPQTAGAFSAVAYFFGRELQLELKVPVGLIHSSWGGTPAEAWTSRPTLARNPEFKQMVDAVDRAADDLPRALKEYRAAQAKWEKEHFVQDPGNKGFDLGYARGDFPDQGWQRMKLPQYWESAGLLIDGAVWFRKTVEVPADRAGKDLILSLGPIDDFDTTYFNGTRVGGIGEETPNYWMAPRKYTVPGSLVRAGRNVIAVRAFDHVGNGGFGGAAADMWLGGPGAQAITLAGEWLYKVELGLEPATVDYATQPIAPLGAGNPNSPTVLYNAMIAPLTHYAIRGAIWYQGESNAGRARQYRALFPAMIRNWRQDWVQGEFPFLFVQLANYQPRKPEPGDSDWAELREAQLMTLKEPATGMAVIIDIGEAGDIHPRNKQDVGHRLALWALAKSYGRHLEFSGPFYESYAVEGNKIRLRFSHGEGLRASGAGAIKGFAIAAADGKFVWAEARIEGSDVVVWSESVAHPTSVRYGWADNPEVNLSNAAGLPASPFRTDREP